MSDNLSNFLSNQGIKKDDEAIQHYGVLGMRWGVRRNRVSVGKNAPKTPTGSASKESAAPKSKRGSASPSRKNTLSNNPKNRKMTDIELRAKINRLDMERRYSELTKPAPKGKSFAQELLAEQGKSVAKTLAARAVSVGLQIALESAAKNATGSNKIFLEGMAKAGQSKKKKD